MSYPTRESLGNQPARHPGGVDLGTTPETALRPQSEIPARNASGSGERSRGEETPGCALDGDNRRRVSEGTNGPGRVHGGVDGDETTRDGRKRRRSPWWGPVRAVADNIRCGTNRAKMVEAPTTLGHSAVHTNRLVGENLIHQRTRQGPGHGERRESLQDSRRRDTTRLETIKRWLADLGGILHGWHERTHLCVSRFGPLDLEGQQCWVTLWLT